MSRAVGDERRPNALSPDEWRAQGRFMELLGYEIFVIESGPPDSSKPTVLLVHGFPTSSWDWEPMWSALSERYHLVGLDLLGFGFSDKPDPHKYSIMEQADLCEALVDSLELESFHVLAHDYGDTVAQELLARQNEGSGHGTWLSMCLLNGGLFPETHRARFIQTLLASPLGPFVSRFSSKRTFDRSFSSVFGPDTQPTANELNDFWSIINHKNGKHIFHNLITYMGDRKTYRERWVSALQQSVVPIGLVNGSLDPVSGAHMVERYRQVVATDHYTVELPTIGHYPQVEAADEVARAYEAFVAPTSAA